MFKKSFIIVLIQALGVIMGFMSIYLIAGDMAPEVYSLVGIYSIVNSIILTFSNLGVETTMMREALYWIRNGEIEKVKEYTTQAILSRVLGFIILIPLVLSYLLFLNYIKYNSEYLLLFLSFYFGSCVSALDDSISLIIRSQGGFVFAQFSQTLNNNIMKFIGIIVYVKFGANFYLYFYALYSIPLLLLFVNKLRLCFSFKYLKFSKTIDKIKEAKFLFMRSYLDFFRSYADSIFVSIMFPSAIMGSYSLFKNFENMIRNFEDGFFDVLSQNIVRYKGDPKSINRLERKYNYARLCVILFVIIAICIFSYNPNFYIGLAHLMQYDCIEQIIYCTALVAIVNLLGKYEISALSLLASSKFNFKFGILSFVVTIISYVFIFVLPSIEGVLFQRVMIYLFISLIGMVLFHKRKYFLYANILK